MKWIKKILGDTSKENLIDLLERIYNDLKIKNPDKDEHWFLANTWMVRYGDWDASRKKGPKLTKYIAYTTTFPYSFLDAPKSIRGLALFLSYKERGDEECENDTEESAEIVGLVRRIQESDNLLEKYKNKNPYTWNEIQAEKDKSIYGLYGFLKSADFLNKNPEEQDQIIKEMEDKANIEEIGIGAGFCLFHGANKAAQSIVEEAEKTDKIKKLIRIDKKTIGHIASELLYFYLHLTDRIAFVDLDSRKRSEFVDEIAFHVFRNYFESYKTVGGNIDVDTFFRIFNDTFKKRQEEYGKYINQEKLFLKFANRVAEILGVKDDMWIIVFIHSIFIPFVKGYCDACKKFISKII